MSVEKKSTFRVGPLIPDDIIKMILSHLSWLCRMRLKCLAKKFQPNYTNESFYASFIHHCRIIGNQMSIETIVRFLDEYTYFYINKYLKDYSYINAPYIRCRTCVGYIDQLGSKFDTGSVENLVHQEGLEYFEDNNLISHHVREVTGSWQWKSIAISFCNLNFHIVITRYLHRDNMFNVCIIDNETFYKTNQYRVDGKIVARNMKGLLRILDTMMAELHVKMACFAKMLINKA